MVSYDIAELDLITLIDFGVVALCSLKIGDFSRQPKSMKVTQKMGDNLNNEDNIENEDNLKNEEALKNEGDLINGS